MLSLKLIRNVVLKIYLCKKRDHLTNRNKMRRSTEKAEATLLTTEFLVCRKHQHEEQIFEDMSQKQEINRFTEESQKLLVDMNHTEIFELCENSAKHQCLDCNAFSDHLLQLRKKFEVFAESCNTPEDQLRLYFNPGFVIEKNSSGKPKHGVSERQVMFYKAKQMLKKARHNKHGNHPTIFSRSYEQEGYRKSLAEHNIGEKEIMLYDRIALERHDYTATKAERLQNVKLWILRLNSDWPQKPLRQVPKFAIALKQCFEDARRSVGGNATNSEIDTSTSTTTTKRSTIRRRSKLRLLCRSEKWMEVQLKVTEKSVGSVFIFNIAVAKLTMAKRVGAHRIPHHLINGGDFSFLRGIPENRRGV